MKIFKTKGKDKYMLLSSAFPSSISTDVDKVRAIIPNKTTPISDLKIQYKVNEFYLTLPYRVYFDEVKEKDLLKLTEQQKNILHCIYSRHCDGYVREKHIKALLLTEYKDWAIPYIVKLCDEYVVEILESIYELLIETDLTRIKQFCKKNRNQFLKSYHRMISYWNEFYRYDRYHFKDYIGRKLFRECFGYSRSIEWKRLSSKILKFEDYMIDVDYINTKSHYDKRQNISEDCTCDGCKNFEIAILHVQHEVKNVFIKMGIDISKPTEIYTIDSSKDNVLQYGGWYTVSGKILEQAYVLAEDEKNTIKEYIQINDDMSFSFQEETNLLYEDFPRPCFQMNILINLKWVLEIPNSYVY